MKKVLATIRKKITFPIKFVCVHSGCVFLYLAKSRTKSMRKLP